MFKKTLIPFLFIMLMVFGVSVSAQSQQYTINPGDTITVHCDTQLTIQPISNKDVDVLCESLPPTNTATNTPTDTTTNTPVNTATDTPTSTAVNTPTSTNTDTSTATNIPPTNTSTPTQIVISNCARPYTANGPWNTPISASPIYDPNWQIMITALAGTFGSDPNQYTMPLYIVDSSTPIRRVTLSGTLSNVIDDTTIIRGSSIMVPIPNGVSPAAGGDAQIVFWNQQTGDEWGFNSVVVNSDGSLNVKNGYHYNTNWDGSPPDTFGSRGAGVPYLTGLIRPCEIAQGHIDHAIAFAYDYPTNQFIYPATKSDGSGSYPPDMPEGARLQLNPALTDTQIQGWGCIGSCLIIAKALQKYGMIIIDKSGHPKIYAEYEGTAHWNGVVRASTPGTIPYNQFRVLKIN